MTRPRTIRGNRRPAVKVQRDRLVAAEGVVAGKTSVEIAAELGIAPSSARRLASQGLREAMESGDKLSVENLFNLVVTSFTEVLEDIDATIHAYKSAGKQVPTRVLTTKIAAGLAISKTCGFDSKTFVVSEKKFERPVININIVDDDGTVTPWKPQAEPQKSLPPAPVADAEVVDEKDGSPR
jgi:hypothetical protein